MGVYLNAGMPAIPFHAGHPRSAKKTATSSSMLPLEALPTRSGHNERRATSPWMLALEALPVHSGSAGKRHASPPMPPLEALPARSGHIERKLTLPTMPPLEALPLGSGHVEKQARSASASPAPFTLLISLVDHAMSNGIHDHFMGALS
ncbi:hypothetical protein FIBSPDRAFT_60488 [Athelia psychrophila]|uniref:Uncharacterized protein n=1 Tax=Athelia psychrophila TaxID=1759441 RepID=A0A166F574_9AGAM|nr:hypothetical protein FIBSPDRAFT_60488 [Fibularhizoctonia sp. CBS 109695]